MGSNNALRFLDKEVVPTPQEIEQRLGNEAMHRLNILDDYLKANYDVVRELKFPFGNQYGWGYKYSSKRKLLCYVFFEKGAFTVTITIGKAEVPKLERLTLSYRRSDTCCLCGPLCNVLSIWSANSHAIVSSFGLFAA
jgi:hypothetical protein